MPWRTCRQKETAAKPILSTPSTVLHMWLPDLPWNMVSNYQRNIYHSRCGSKPTQSICHGSSLMAHWSVDYLLQETSCQYSISGNLGNYNTHVLLSHVVHVHLNYASETKDFGWHKIKDFTVSDLQILFSAWGFFQWSVPLTGMSWRTRDSPVSPCQRWAHSHSLPRGGRRSTMRVSEHASWWVDPVPVTHHGRVPVP